jgi:hypothetical protein
MTGTNCDLFTHKSSRSYLNHLVCVCVCVYIYMHVCTHIYVYTSINKTKMNFIGVVLIWPSWKRLRMIFKNSLMSICK